MMQLLPVDDKEIYRTINMDLCVDIYIYIEIYVYMNPCMYINVFVHPASPLDG